MIEEIVSKVADENTNDVLGHVGLQLVAHATTPRRHRQRRVDLETVRTLGTTRGRRYATAAIGGEQDRVDVGQKCLENRPHERALIGEDLARLVLGVDVTVKEKLDVDVLDVNVAVLARDYFFHVVEWKNRVAFDLGECVLALSSGDQQLVTQQKSLNQYYFI